jgi:hypothetical protein
MGYERAGTSVTVLAPQEETGISLPQSPQYRIAVAGALVRAVIGHKGADTDIPGFLRVLAQTCAENEIGRLLLVVVGAGIREHAMDSDALYDGAVALLQAGLPPHARIAVVAEEANTRRVYHALAMAAPYLGGRHDVECLVFGDEASAALWLRDEPPREAGGAGEPAARE